MKKDPIVNLKELQKLSMSNWSERVAEELSRKSLEQVPEDTGDLKDSIHTETTDETVKVYYTSPYAAYQHEGMRADGTRVIQNRPAGGNSKFLERPWKDNKDRWKKYARQEVKKKIKSII